MTTARVIDLMAALTASLRETELQRRAISTGGALTPADIEANDVEFRCEPDPEPDPFPASVKCGWCGGEGRLTTGGDCAECEGTGEVATP
jgi:hypothetical protein